MNRAFKFCSSLVVAAAALAGCSFEHAAAVDYDHMVKVKDGYTIVGYVHAETWTPAVFYVFPILPFQNADKASSMALAKAQNAFNADGLMDLQIHTDTHMWFFPFGWVENHVSATAIANGGK